MIKRTSLLCVMILIGINAYSQITPIIQESYKNIIPPSPNASELGKYIEIPVNTYTGIPDISIPLFEIKGRDITIPITLKYHASGIKVEQAATWVGLGWSLNAGGLITRTVRGVPDDQYEPWVSWSNKGSQGLFYSKDAYDEVLSNDNELVAQNAGYIAEGAYDGESDIFYYNFLDQSGKFIFDVHRNIHLIPMKDYVTDFTMEEENPISGFSITDEKGVEFIFDEVEKTEVVNLPLSQKYNSSWYLSQINSQFENVIFTYEDEQMQEKQIESEIYYIDGEETKVVGKHVEIPELRMDCKRLSRIDWSGGYIIFDGSVTRDDIGYHKSQTKLSKALNKISIYNSDNVLIKEYNFQYKYFNNTNCSDDPEEDYLCKRLRLDLLYESNGLETKPPYRFFYNETSLPPRNSYEQDYWGYYNGNLATTFIPNLYGYPSDYNNSSFLSTYSFYARNNFTGNQYFLDIGADRSPNEDKVKAGILNKIQYPTGGYVELNYQMHQFYFDGENKDGGGLRISSSIYKEDESSPAIEKIYGYSLSNDASQSSGRITLLPQFAYQRTNANISVSDLNSLKKITWVTTSSLGGLGETQGSHVGYKEVSLHQTGNGKVIYKYDMPATQEDVYSECIDDNCLYNRTLANGTYGIYLCWPNYPNGSFTTFYAYPLSNRDNFPYAPNPNFDWGRGQLLEEIHFEEQDLIKPIEKIVYEYDIKDYIKIDAVKCGYMGSVYTSNPPRLCTWKENGETKRPDHADYFYYKIGKYYNISAWKVPISKTEYFYDRSNKNNYRTKETIYKYEGNGHHLITGLEEKESNGDWLKTQYRYPKDVDNYSGSEPTNPVTIAILAMARAKHMLIYPIEIIKYKDDKVIEALVQTYQEYPVGGNKIRPYRIYKLEPTFPINISDYSESGFTSNPVLPLEVDSKFKIQTLFDGYDNYGNLLQYHKLNDLVKSYVWGYNDTYPIAEVSNANLNQVAFTSFEDLNTYGGWVYDVAGVTPLSSECYDIADIECMQQVEEDTSCEEDCTNSCNGNQSCYESCLDGCEGSIYSGCMQEQLPACQNSVQSKTGERSFTGSSISKSGLPSGKYVVSFWAKPTGSSGTVVFEGTNTSITDENWEYFEFETSSNVTSVTLNMGGCYLDELRLFPVGAQMTSYTYKPLVGITSISDPNGKTSYYSYDSFGRLQTIKDNDGNILQSYEYNYKQ